MRKAAWIQMIQLLEAQFDQGLHCLLFYLHLLHYILHGRTALFQNQKFWVSSEPLWLYSLFVSGPDKKPMTGFLAMRLI